MGKKLFKEQANGYDKNQVENYIRKLIKTYEIVYREYLNVIDTYHTPSKFEMTSN